MYRYSTYLNLSYYFIYEQQSIYVALYESTRLHLNFTVSLVNFFTQNLLPFMFNIFFKMFVDMHFGYYTQRTLHISFAVSDLLPPDLIYSSWLRISYCSFHTQQRCRSTCLLFTFASSLLNFVGQKLLPVEENRKQIKKSGDD